MRRRSVPSLLALAIAAVFLAPPAVAEGGFTSYMKGWLPGHETRDWQQKVKNSDTPETFQAKQCDYDTGGVNVSSIHMELNRNDTWTPDEHYGAKRIACSPHSVLHYAAWSHKGQGNFDLALRRIDGQTVSYKGKLNAKYVRVSY